MARIHREEVGGSSPSKPTNTLEPFILFGDFKPSLGNRRGLFVSKGFLVNPYAGRNQIIQTMRNNGG